jgi:hypothetical protein
LGKMPGKMPKTAGETPALPGNRNSGITPQSLRDPRMLAAR